ncbi:NAD(P)H-binding protein [Kineosporia rhizophila]|uniref:NAD(P)-dependent oxidoreductase n=1 Tax=Kineosporia rhizophila TaxID=84633 RepID=UPI001E434D7F|nr:NAD(P)H-binding protein [Kineosporia rhizophila]MCE0535257.1 NAD(P)H-binding protein [Kineosporia rhizophila]
MSQDSPLVVTGAGGRAGRAVVAEAVRRGRPVVAVVRDPARAADLSGAEGVRVIAGNALAPARLTPARLGLTTAPAGWVSTVSPFTAPPASFEGFDPGFYSKVGRAALDSLEAAGGERLVVVGLFATLSHAGGRVLDDAALFPPTLRPFAEAHAAGVQTLDEEAGELDWLVLAPPPLLSAEAASTGGYLLGDHRFDPGRAGAALSYADLAVAVLDEVERPTRHREQVAVLSRSAA